MKYNFTFFKKSTGKYYTEEVLWLDNNVYCAISLQKLLENKKGLPNIFKDEDFIAVVNLDDDNSVPFLYEFKLPKNRGEIVKNCKDYTDCIFYKAVETDYDVTNGHSSYIEYCTKTGEDKRIIGSINCKKCSQDVSN